MVTQRLQPGSVVVFRVDASVQIGSGHVMRCLTLADALRASSVNCHFLCRAHAGHMIDAICSRGYVVHELPVAKQDVQSTVSGYERWLGCDWLTDARHVVDILSELSPDWLVIDHYSLDRRWEVMVSEYCSHLMVIDDLADRTHECDLLLDQNLGRHDADYVDLVSSHCAMLIGPQYALLRPEFAALRVASLARRTHGKLRQILLSLGGVDQENVTGTVLETLRTSQLPLDVRLVVVMGGQAPWLEQVRAQVATMPWSMEVLVNTSAMAQCMADSDLAIGAAGGSAWERCCLGLPALLVVQADNQRSGAQALAASGAAILIGEVSDVAGQLSRVLDDLMLPSALAAMSIRAADVTDGTGVSRVLSAMRGLDVSAS